MNPSAEAAEGQSIWRPGDVFSGAKVERKLVTEVLAAIAPTAAAHQTIVEIQMPATGERNAGTVRDGKAMRIPKGNNSLPLDSGWRLA